MRIPSEKEEAKRLDLYIETIAACKASREARLEQYALNRRWFLYGSNSGVRSPWNKLWSHIDTVSSFLYAADTTKFSVRMGTSATKEDRRRAPFFAGRVNEEWRDSNADEVYGQAVVWSLVFGSMFVKNIRRKGGRVEPFCVDPGSFGVYQEDTPMLDRQEAFTHWYYLTLPMLERKLQYHPKRNDIMAKITAARTKKDTSTAVPPLIDRVVTTSTNPNIVGEANLLLDAPPEYTAQLDVDLVEIAELYCWNDAEDDYQMVTMASDVAVIYDRLNIYMPRSKEFEAEQPFVQLCPNPMYDYFWGLPEIDMTIPLQDERNDAFRDIKKLLKKQVDPPGMYFGMGLVEEKLDAFNSPGSQVAGGEQGTANYLKVDVPATVYERVHTIDSEMDDRSALTNVLRGQGETGVRSGGHANKLANLASSRPKKRALTLEDALERGAYLYGRSLFMGDDRPVSTDDDEKFVIASLSPHFYVDVDAHSNSPVFVENQKEDAGALFKSKAITRKRLIKMVNPPMQDEILRELNEEIIPQEKEAVAAQIAMEQAKAGGGAPVPKTGPRAVG